MSKSKTPQSIDPLITECALKIQRLYAVEARRMVRAVELYQSHSLIQLKSSRLNFPRDQWNVISQSNPNQVYHVNTEHMTCTCEDFTEQTQFHAPDEEPICKHIAAVLLKLKVDAERERMTEASMTPMQKLDALIAHATSPMNPQVAAYLAEKGL